MSRELILKMSISIDGFVGGPNGEIDWIFRSATAGSTARVAELIGQAGVHAMGRRSYQDMAAFWPTSTHPVAAAMNEIPKVVFSRSGQVSHPNPEALAEADPAVADGWLNPGVLGADLVADVHRLKQEEGLPILAHGGASFAASLIAARLVDKFILVTHAVALGRGLPIFDSLEAPLYLKLEHVEQFESGAVIKTYRPE